MPMRDTLLGAFAEIDERAERARLALRLTGSIAVQLRCPRHGALAGPERRFADLDLVAYKRDAPAIRELLLGIGYAENREVFVVSEGGRAIFDHQASRVHVDVFFDRLDFCHVIDLRGRIERDPRTLPLAELLLGKLQIVKINAKDLLDAGIVLLEHDFGADDGEAINSARIGALCAEDWGLWRTVSGNLDKLARFVESDPAFGAAARARIPRQAATLRAAIDAVPKPFAWRMRARLGERVRWYRDVEEVDG
jgi:hypothetical protein